MQTIKQKQTKIEIIRHSLAHILAAAVKELYPKVKFGIGPTIENGFYYDLSAEAFGKGGLSLGDLPKIEKKMRELIKKDLQFEKKKISKTQAKKIFKGQPYKLELINDLPEKTVSIYKSDDFTDLCKGPHIKSAKELQAIAFKLTKTAGAYWKGDEKNPMLTRIYGVAFNTQKELDDYLLIQAEAEKRDHRKLGKELELFTFDQEVGLGLPLWQPNGALLWRIIEDFWYQEHLKNGYQLVRTPHIGSRKLWEKSGHWNFYSESMYPPMEVGLSLEEAKKGKKAKVKEEYLIKPMNCPLQIAIFKSKPHSYRDLPIRWAECGTVYRYERSGTLSGLTRVRGFTQDDAHIICSKEQIKDELKKVADFITYMLSAFGFKDYNVYLSVRDPKNKTKYAGKDKEWTLAENALEKIAKDKKLKYIREEGEAVFYGPKLDFKIKDTLGKEWQCSTLQFDFNLPERFGMSFINKDGNEETPYMIHRALLGSFERFIGVLIEHYAGAFPVWLSPEQVHILPIGKAHIKFAEKVLNQLIESNVRAVLKDENETLGKKIRGSEQEKVPYILVIGDKEIKANSVGVRQRKKGDIGQIKISKFIEKIADEIKNRK